MQMEKFVSVGSRFNDRTVVDSPVPIDVITDRDLHENGYTELGQALSAMVPSLDFPRPTITDGTDHIRPATLRGLSPDQTLVLINGKRRHTSALVNLNGSVGRGSSAVDLNAIPSFALSGAEVLRDGAAAQYGSDAIAGVINLTLRKDLGWDFTSTVGQYYKGDGAIVEGAANGGAALGKDGGFVNATAFFRNRGYTDRSGPDLRQQYFGTNATTGAQTTLSSTGAAGVYNGTPDPRETTVARHDSRQGDPSSHERGVFFNAEYPVKDGIDLYAFGGASTRDSLSAANWRRSGDNNTVRAIYPDGFLPKIVTRIQDYSISFGIDGTVEQIKWSLSETYGENDLKYWTDNSVNVSYGAASPTNFYDGSLLFKQATTNFDVSRPFDVGLASPLKVAAGAEFRWEDYLIRSGDTASWANGGFKVLDGPNAGAQPSYGSQGFPGFRPGDVTDATRSNIAGYVDVENNITSKWNIDLAARGEHYTDAGSTLTGKIATRYEIVKGFAARASANTGFRAPSLAQQYFTTTSTNFINGLPFDIKTFQVTDPAAIALGAKSLKPEKSTNFSGGFTFNPIENFTASIDYYYIKINDRVVLSSNFTGASVSAFLTSIGVPGIGGGRYFTNGIDTRTQGADFTSSYTFKLPSGDRLKLTAAANVNNTKVTRVADTPANVLALTGGTPIFDYQSIGRFQKGTPRTTLNFSATYDLGKMFTFLVREVRYGEVTSYGTIPNGSLDQTLGAKWLTDVDVSYHYNKKLSVGVGANNVFNTNPDKLNSLNNISGINQYSSFSPFGFNGGFYYGRVDFKF